MDRRGLERRLERGVQAHRTTIAVVFPLVGAVLLILSAEGVLPEPLAYNPALILGGTLVMRTPLVAGVAPLLDRRAVGLLLALTGYAYAIEAVGLATGWPYGAFEYAAELGPMVGGLPLALPIFFVPLVINAYLLSVLLLGDWGARRSVRLAAVLGCVIAIDLVLDPAAVAIGFWTYGGGPYYGVPLSNFGGWLLSGAVGVLLLDAAFDRGAIRARLDRCDVALDDLVSFVLLWGVINLVYGNWIPVLVAVGIGVGLHRTERFDLAVPRVAAMHR